MREPVYRRRPVEPNPAAFDTGVRINDFIVLKRSIHPLASS